MICATKLCCHLKSYFKGQRPWLFGFTHHNISCLGVIEHVVGILACAPCERVLPVVVGHLTVSYMAFDMEESAGKRKSPVVGQCQSHLRYRTGIDAQGLRTRAKLTVFQFHGIVLAAYSQYTVKPTPLNKGLLYGHRTGIVAQQGDVKSVA